MICFSRQAVGIHRRFSAPRTIAMNLRYQPQGSDVSCFPLCRAVSELRKAPFVEPSAVTSPADPIFRSTIENSSNRKRICIDPICHTLIVSVR